jgi:hypothetical protein
MAYPSQDGGSGAAFGLFGTKEHRRRLACIFPWEPSQSSPPRDKP